MGCCQEKILGRGAGFGGVLATGVFLASFGGLFLGIYFAACVHSEPNIKTN